MLVSSAATLGGNVKAEVRLVPNLSTMVLMPSSMTSVTLPICSRTPSLAESETFGASFSSLVCRV